MSRELAPSRFTTPFYPVTCYLHATYLVSNIYYIIQFTINQGREKADTQTIQDILARMAALARN